MGFDALWNAFVASLPTLKDAWPTVIGLMILATLAGFGFSSLLGASAHHSKDQRLKLAEERVADYKERLEGQSPEQAAEQIADLREQIRSLKAIQPWTFTDQQLAAISRKIASHPTGVRIVRDVGSARLETAQAQLVAVFEAAQWTPQHWPSMGKPKEPHENITICASSKVDAATLDTLKEAFRDAGVLFSEQVEETDDVMPMIWFSAARSRAPEKP